MLRNSWRSVLSLLRSNHCPPTVSWCRRLFFSAAAALAAVGVYSSAARLRYGVTEPFTGCTHLALLSHQQMRDSDEALFAEFKKKHAADILDPNHDDTIRVRRILDEVIHAAHQGLALRQAKMAQTSKRHTHEYLRWIDGLDWEVVIVRDEEIHRECYTGAGKIVVHSGSLQHDRTDAEIAVTLTHEAGHVIARHGSGIFDWLVILLGMPIFLLLRIPSMPLVLHFIRSEELEANHIGILLLAAAGVDPLIAIQDRQKEAEMEGDTTWIEYLKSTHPTWKKRCRCLSQPKVLGEALELYTNK